LVLLACTFGCRHSAVGYRPSAIGNLPSAEIEQSDLLSSFDDSRQPVSEVAQSAQSEQHLHQAVALLEKGKDAEATTHLERYVAERPDQLIARANLGELLFRQHRFEDCKFHFELFIACAQEQGDAAFRYLIHCHSRLVEVSEEEEDAYEEHLNRGIGLYLLACRRASEPNPDAEPTVDALLCRAAVELREAREEQPDEARPQLYLYQIWSRLGQQAAALQALHGADTCQLFGRLTPLERRELQMACLKEQSQAKR
jgi:hypothetical protein